MTGIRASELAGKLGLSRGRISQLVRDGVFDGCFRGSGRDRRFDLDKCAAAYHKLDPGQRLGNGAKTQKAIARIAAETSADSGNGARADGSDPLPGGARLNQLTAEVESVLREGARRVADDLGVDFREVRKILMDQWRGHRERRSGTLSREALEAGLSGTEREADI